jgi:hypothetical protein
MKGTVRNNTLISMVRYRGGKLFYSIKATIIDDTDWLQCAVSSTPGRVVVFSISSALYLILGWSDSFLCLSALYHYVKITDTINLKGEIYILSVDFGVFWVSSLGLIGFGPVQVPKVHHGRS